MDAQLQQFIDVVSGLSTTAMLFLLLLLWWRYSSRQAGDDSKLMQGMMNLFSTAMTEISAAMQEVAKNTQALRQLVERQEALANDRAVAMRTRVDAMDLTIATIPETLAQQGAQLDALATAHETAQQESHKRDMVMLDLLNKMSRAVESMEEAVRMLQASQPEFARQISSEIARLESTRRDWIAAILRETSADTNEAR